MTVAEASRWSPGDAIDAAYAGESCEVVSADGIATVLPVQRWQRAADPADHDLFVAPCQGRVLDIGCGPGRLTAALAFAGVRTLGIDTSGEAVRQARWRGASAIRRNVFEHLPAFWDTVLLADGNIGIGGDPARVLRRCAELVRAGGRVLVEVGDHGAVRREHLRLRIGGELTEPFVWASVGIGAIEAVAVAAGFYLDSVAIGAGRHVATLVHEA